jgi:hypothetical protein
MSRKEGTLKRREGSFLTRGWVDRWVKLEGRELKIFKTQGVLPVNTSKLLFTMSGDTKPLYLRTIVEETRVIPSEREENCFAVEIPPEKPIEFCAASAGRFLCSTENDIQGRWPPGLTYLCKLLWA